MSSVACDNVGCHCNGGRFCSLDTVIVNEKGLCATWFLPDGNIRREPLYWDRKKAETKVKEDQTEEEDS